MRFASFSINGSDSYGLVVNGGLFDLRKRVAERYPTLLAAIASGEALNIGKRFLHESPDVDSSQVVFLPPIPLPGKLVCFGGAFASHLAELKKDIPKYPGFHIRSSSSLVGDGVPLMLPSVSRDLDYECELAIVIGNGGRNIAKADAMNHVFGYSCFDDGSIRDYQTEHSMCAGKNFNASGSFGPWIVTPDEVGDMMNLKIRTIVNGVALQEATLGEMLLTPADFIAYASTIMHFHPGDVITSGCPGGVGYFRDPKLYLKAGDDVKISIDRIGVLHHTVIDGP
jgi:2-keto-4-pentenoate hydratase/2-oxohepta-3-ene-1,7-dioic acid hydratase in catechol pathway